MKFLKFILATAFITQISFAKDLLVDKNLWNRFISQDIAHQRTNEILWKQRYEAQCSKYGATEPISNKPQTGDCVECRKMAETGGLTSDEFTNLKGPSDEYRQWVALNQAMDMHIAGMEKTLPAVQSMQKSFQSVLKNPTALSADTKLSNYIKSITNNIALYAQLNSQLDKIKNDPKQKSEETAIHLALDRMTQQTPQLLHKDVQPWIEKTKKFMEENKGDFSVGLTFLGFTQNQSKINSAINSAFTDQIKLVQENLTSLKSLKKNENALREKWRLMEKSDSPKVASTKAEYSKMIDKMLYAVPLLQVIYGTDPKQLPGLERAVCELQKRTEDRMKYNEDSAKQFSMIVGIAAGVATMGMGTSAVGVTEAALARASASSVLAGTAPAAAMDFGVVLAQNVEKCKSLFATALTGDTVSRDTDISIRDQYLECQNNYSDAASYMGWGYAAGTALPLLKPISGLMKNSFRTLSKTQAEKALEKARLDRLVPDEKERKEIAELTTSLYNQRNASVLAQAEEAAAEDIPKIKQEIYAGIQSGKISSIAVDEEFAKRYTASVQNRAKTLQEKMVTETDEEMRKLTQTCGIAGNAK